jgi:16S rRNA (cytosine1402-N4)-methyltransferase
VDSHVPVLLDEVLGALAIRPEGLYVDGTFGRGGHARAIIERLGGQGRLLGLDRDPAAAVFAGELAARDARFAFVDAPFSGLGEVLHERYPGVAPMGILLDIGVSSPQLDAPERGFSFRADGPLDMRMDPRRGESAAEWLARAGEREIADVLFRLGEERAARRIARLLVQSRRAAPIERTSQLAELVARVVRGEPGRHPATRSFQAIRMHVNRELPELEQGLAASLDALAPGGRLAVISFHSLEDRIVKRFMRDHTRIDPALRSVPVVPEAAQPRLRLVGRAVRAGAQELAENPRARSATLRVAEKLR